VIGVVVGPTAVGKSALAVGLALRLGADGQSAEIVNADSMALYRGMDIGTAKSSAAERAAVPHHLLDVLDVSENASVAEFQRMARTAISDCQARGAIPIIVGGSALYVRAIVDQFDFPGTDAHLRDDLERQLASSGPSVLHARLAELDPKAAARILPNNGRRIVRALEVITLTGRPFVAELPDPVYALPGVVQIGLDIDRPTLDVRIEQRVDQMWQQGFVNEVRRLAQHGLAESRTASRALGYRQVLDYLAGLIDEDEARGATVQATRRFARRQDSWFRRDARIAWIRFDHPQRVDVALEMLHDAQASESAADVEG
jgi:tRNA dimethylallyltransferase